MLRAASAAGAASTAVHCCAADVPLALLRSVGADAVAVDVSLLGRAGWESVAVAVEAGTTLWAGVVPTTGALPAVRDAGRGGPRALARVGLPLDGLSRRGGHPACGLAGSSPARARAALTRSVETARELAEVAAA